ncbi:MAG TPA: hypothetical protein VKX17_07435 [Planctomycetota bacterium]|nr:hypothetical protein [Planctomycetota bacterium]
MRAHTTLLFIDTERVLRADLPAPDARDARLFQQTRGGMGLSEAVRSALGLSGGCGRNVFVAADEIWGQQLTLPAVAVGGLSGAELSGALAFEAEPLSGIPSPHAAMGFVANGAPRTDGMRDFTVIAMESSVRDAVQTALRKAGGKLRGVCSLKDLPARNAGGPPAPQDAGSMPAPQQAGETLAVQEPLSEKEWVLRCAKALMQTPAAIALVAPAPQRISPLRYWAAGLLLEAAAITVCVLHWKSMQRIETDAGAALQGLRAPQKLFDELRAKNETLKTDLKKAEEQVATASATLDGAAREVALLRVRLPAILASLAKAKPADIVIRSIQSKDAQTLTVEGLSLEAGLADKFAAQLETALNGEGLRVQPLSKTAEGIAANGGPWKFSLQIASESATPRNEPAKPSVHSPPRSGGRP